MTHRAVDTCYTEGNTSASRTCREDLASDILAIAARPTVLDALKVYIQNPRSETRPDSSRILSQKGTQLAELRGALDRGLSVIINASCGRRLETFHWAVTRFDQNDESALDIINAIFMEARCQMSEMEAEDKAVIAEVFGV